MSLLMENHPIFKFWWQRIKLQWRVYYAGRHLAHRASPRATWLWRRSSAFCPCRPWQRVKWLNSCHPHKELGLCSWLPGFGNWIQWQLLSPSSTPRRHATIEWQNIHFPRTNFCHKKLYIICMHIKSYHIVPSGTSSRRVSARKSLPDHWHLINNLGVRDILT